MEQTTVAAVIEGANELEWSATVPSLHHRKEGWLSDQENVAKHPLTAKPGWFSDGNKRKTTPAASVSVASRNFLMTQPPLAVMQGGDYAARFQFVHTCNESGAASPLDPSGIHFHCSL